MKKMIKKTLLSTVITAMCFHTSVYAMNGEQQKIPVLSKKVSGEAKKRLNEKLLNAASFGEAGEIQRLLDAGADIEAGGFEGLTALMKASRLGRVDNVLTLLERGANINATDDQGDTALIHAAEWGNPSTTQVLIDKGADIHVKNEGGVTALMAAEQYLNDISRQEQITHPFVNIDDSVGFDFIPMGTSHIEPQLGLRLNAVIKILQDAQFDKEKRLNKEHPGCSTL